MRLLTRSDFDGLACAAILKEVGVIDSWKFVHPKDIQDGIVEVTKNDVLANIPYAKGCAMWFDHHSSEGERVVDNDFEGAVGRSPSAARLIYNYYNGEEKLPHLRQMVEGVDVVDSGNLSIGDILYPKGWVLLGFIMDPRTGLGRIRNFRISNYQLMEALIEACQTMKIDQILNLPDVKERVEVYHSQESAFKQMIKEYTTVEENVIVTDLRGIDPIVPGNRFMIYSIYPNQNISIWIVDGREQKNCVFAVGHSIINRTSVTNVGSLMLKYGGGGHPMVGTCQVPYADADRVMRELVDYIKADNANYRS